MLYENVELFQVKFVISVSLIQNLLGGGGQFILNPYFVDRGGRGLT